MIGMVLIVAAMALAAWGVGSVIFGLSDKPPFGLSLMALRVVCIVLAVLGVILLRMGV